MAFPGRKVQCCNNKPCQPYVMENLLHRVYVGKHPNTIYLPTFHRHPPDYIKPICPCEPDSLCMARCGRDFSLFRHCSLDQPPHYSCGGCPRMDCDVTNRHCQGLQYYTAPDCSLYYRPQLDSPYRSYFIKQFYGYLPQDE